MNKTFGIALGALGGLLLTAATPISAATLDEVIARLDAIQRENAAMRKEIASLRAQQHVTPVSDARRSRASQPVTSSHHGAPRDAMAADMSSRPSPYDSYRPYDWSGFHVGVHTGYGQSQTKWDALIARNGNFTGIVDNGYSHTASGWLSGVHTGIDFQTGRMVFGAGASLSYAPIEHQVTSPGALNITTDLTENITWIGTVTGRVGYAFDNNILLYGKGGAAVANVDYVWTVHALGSVLDRGSQTRFGWTVGAGAEYAFRNNWSASIEYNYVDFGAKREPFGGSPGLVLSHDAKTDLHLVKAGLNYRFGASY